MRDFERFFAECMGPTAQPYPYQAKLAQGEWPDVLNVPTGLGKTTMVTRGWLLSAKGDEGFRGPDHSST
jgi:CRISPR-associated endonuclease/helicase Cas3